MKDDRRIPTRLAKGAPSWAAPCGGLAPLAALLAMRTTGYGRRAALAVAVGSAATAAFFRDPDRAPGEGRVLAAADGVVSAIVEEPDGRVRIATFMGLQNVHVNRAPVTGIVRRQEHRPGGYRPAFRKDSEANERLDWVIESHLGELYLSQIAGIVARRIVPYHEIGASVGRGERIGMIRFGSRVDVTLPAGLAAGVRVGQRVRAGRTRLDRPD